MHHYYDVTVVRRVANTNEQSDDFMALPKARKWRSFAKGRRAVAMVTVAWAPESSPLNEMQHEDFRVDVLERVGEVGAELNTVISTNIMRLPWSLFQPQKVRFSLLPVDRNSSSSV